jgi:hypothetical protein
MPLYHIKANELPLVWGVVAPLLQKAIDLDPKATSVEHVNYTIRIGTMNLLVWEEDDKGITGAATVSFTDHPTERIAQVHLMGGSGVVRKHVFEHAQNWMRANGATKAQCWCQDNLVPMYEKMGLVKTHNVMRIEL